MDSLMSNFLILVRNASGFLGVDVDALAAGMEAVLSDELMSTLDPLIPRLIWDKKVYESNRKMKIGYYEGDSVLPVTPGILRALRMSKKALQSRGHEVVTFNLPDMMEFFEMALDILLSDGGATMLKHWEGDEIIDDAVKFNKKVISAPSFVKYAIQKYYSFSSPLLAKMASRKT